MQKKLSNKEIRPTKKIAYNNFSKNKLFDFLFFSKKENKNFLQKIP